jgi:filamentous hemagglutinin
LTKAACLAVKCWAEYPVGSDEYNKNYVSQLEATQLGPEVAWVTRQQEAGLFNYTPRQKITDMVKSDPLGVGKDALKVGLGAVTAKTGGLLCGSAAGCAVGGWMFVFGTSDAIEGATSLANRYDGITASGWNPLRSGFSALAPTWGNTIYDGINLGTALVALKVPVPLNVGTLDGLNRPTSMFDVMVPNINNAKSVPFIGPSVSANQASLWLGVGTKAATFINDVRNAGEKK